MEVERKRSVWGLSNDFMLGLLCVFYFITNERCWLGISMDASMI